MPLDLNDPEVKAAIEAAAKEAAAKLVDETHTGLAAKRDELLGTNRTLKDELQKFEGLDPVAVRKMVDDNKKLEEEKLLKAGDFEKALDIKAQEFQGLIKDRDTKIDKLFAQLQTEKINTVSLRALTEAKGSVELLMPHMDARIKLDDDFNVKVMDKDGSPMFDKNGKPADINDLVEEFKGDPMFGRAFEANVGTGSGARNSGQGDGGNVTTADNPFVRRNKAGEPDKNAAWDVYKGMAMFRKDPDLARKMADEAGEKIKGVNVPSDE